MIAAEEVAASTASKPSILSYVNDLPNLCSLAGLGCTLAAIYFSVLGYFSAAMIGMVWAVAFDWADGLVARSQQGRTGADSSFGAQLDLLIDIVSYGVAPAILLLSYGSFEPIFLVGAFLMLAAAALRLSYFSTFGLSDDSKYTGLALDNNSLLIVFLFLFEGVFSQPSFALLLGATCLGLAFLNVSNVKNTKTFRKPRQCCDSSVVYAWDQRRTCLDTYRRLMPDIIKQEERLC